MGSRLKRDAHEKALVKIGFSGFGETAFQPQSDLFEDRIRTFGPILPDRKRPFGWQRLVGPASLSALLEHAGLSNIEVREVKIGYLSQNKEDWWDICWNSGFRGPLAQINNPICSSSKRIT